MFVDRYDSYCTELVEDRLTKNGKLTEEDISPVIDVVADYFTIEQTHKTPEVMEVCADSSANYIPYMLRVTITHGLVSAYFGAVCTMHKYGTDITFGETAEVAHVFNISPMDFVSWFSDCVTALEIKRLTS